MILPLSTTMSNEQIAEVFSFMSQIIAMNPDARFPARAYEEASVIIRQLDYELQEKFHAMHAATSDLPKQEFLSLLDALPGIGAAISKKLVELFTTGHIAVFEEEVKALPGGMFPLMKIHGIGAKKALSLTTTFHLDDAATAISKLLTHAKAGEIRTLDGFGIKSEEAIIATLEQQHQKARMPYDDAFHIATTMKNELEKLASVRTVMFLGSLRRHAATVGDIDLGVAADDPKQVVKDITTIPSVKTILSAGENLASVILSNGIQVDMKFAKPSEWGSFIQHFTGSKQHNIALREHALKRGLSLSEHGVKVKETGKLQTFAREEEFYTFLGFKHIPPEERVGGDEFERYAL